MLKELKERIKEELQPADFDTLFIEVDEEYYLVSDVEFLKEEIALEEAEEAAIRETDNAFNYGIRSEFNRKH